MTRAMLSRRNTRVGPQIVFIVVDSLRFPVLLIRECVTVASSQMSTVSSPHRVFLTIDSTFLSLKVRCLTRRQLTAPGALRNPRLLIAFAFIDLMTLVVRGLSYQAGGGQRI
jgi:hypothetical protein